MEGDTIKGTPTAAGTFSITVTVTNSFGADTKNFSIKVAN
ncbi:MAG: putative Ig domain-containing protein [Clostridia bacterium]